MRLLVSFLLVVPAMAQLGGFSVIGSESTAWPQILASIGLYPSTAAQAKLVVARSGALASPEWKRRVESGLILILEGDSPLAQSFGFRASLDTTRLAILSDIHQPKLPLILEKPVEIPRFTIPADARVFTRERWTGAPAVVGWHLGKGAVLWIAASPGPQGYERFPFLPHALADLGLQSPFRSSQLWAFFDYSYRVRVDLDYFAANWRRAGINALHVAAWHFYDFDPERDAYLKRLIEACHREGVLVYAWLELPHVSERFWADHPAWREKTGILQDAQLDWRKLMNLADPDCKRAVQSGVRNLIDRYDWDGINFAELYYESLEGAANPARFTPMNEIVRGDFRAKSGFDPAELWSSHRDAASLRAFLDYRAELARGLQDDWMLEASTYRKTRPDLDIVLTHVDDRLDAGMRDAIGADTAHLLPALDQTGSTLLVEDPATVWNRGPSRYTELANRYPRSTQLAIDINIVDRYQDVYPTKQQTGLELFQLVHLAAKAFPRVALYVENSLSRVDLPFLPSAASAVEKVEEQNGSVTIQAAREVGITWKGSSTVDGHLWPVQDGETVWLPPGLHTVGVADTVSPIRLERLSAHLNGATIQGGVLEFNYQSNSRALATVSPIPKHIQVDGVDYPVHFAGSALVLPRGNHSVTIQ